LCTGFSLQNKVRLRTVCIPSQSPALRDAGRHVDVQTPRSLRTSLWLVVLLWLQSIRRRDLVMERNRIIKRGMVIILLFFSGSVAFAEILPEDPTRGEQLFVNKGCVRCHDVSGEGSKIGPDLVKKDLGDTPLELAAKLWNHTPSMVLGMEGTRMIKPALTRQEFNDLSVYLYFLRFSDGRGNPVRGRTVFSEKGCHLCHPFAGKGRQDELGFVEFPRNISPIFLSKGNHSLAMIARMAQIGMKWPKFRETEMMDLFEYIKVKAKGADDPAFFRPGNPKEGKQIFNTRGCDKCHSIRGEGAKGGVDLGKEARAFRTSLTEIASSMWNKGPTILAKMAQAQSGIPKLTSKETVDLFAYLYFLSFTDEPGSIMNGKILFSEMRCTECHGQDWKRGRLSYIDHSKYQAISKTDLVASIWNHSLEIKKAAKEGQLPWPLIGKREMADLVEYILAPQRVSRDTSNF
jgi:cytochrome c